MNKLVELKSEICSALRQDLSNSEKQKLGELFSLVDTLLLNKFEKVNSKDFNSLYKEVLGKLVRNPNSKDAKLMLDRIKNADVSENGFVYMKLLQIKIILEGYNNTTKIVKLIEEINYAEEYR